MISAVGGTAGPPTSHMVIVARSRSIHGPWENCPHNPIVRTVDPEERWWSRGHATMFEGRALREQLAGRFRKRHLAERFVAARVRGRGSGVRDIGGYRAQRCGRRWVAAVLQRKALCRPVAQRHAHEHVQGRAARPLAGERTGDATIPFAHRERPARRHDVLQPGWREVDATWFAAQVSGYHHNTGGELVSLRPALYAGGSGECRFRNFTYRAGR